MLVDNDSLVPMSHLWGSAYSKAYEFAYRPYAVLIRNYALSS